MIFNATVRTVSANEKRSQSNKKACRPFWFWQVQKPTWLIVIMSLFEKKKQCEWDVRWEIIQTRVNQSIKKMAFNDDKVYNLEASRCDSCFYVQTQLLNLKKSVKKRKKWREKERNKERKRILTAAMRNHRSVNNFTLIVVDPHFHPNSSYH